MTPEIYFELTRQRAGELQREAEEYRRAREVLDGRPRRRLLVRWPAPRSRTA
ncbi:hypothetical protein [Actinoplanes regularis]|uniref:Uncharacterized protein n=1 Tax=Actinoplanes regularis TaxID=52697 RepID=A0A238WL51_9ACTN|nr:hypothetical protein [Actinoplanes regularis]GIE84763.1 hypothetical protein Are01nite_12430 [Actinoplanes regularis]GLW32383.1 hypothetical protein Areg01_53220 [Actinoplanes regularis]SNR47306.1 hypothetical protein SAMN06264365_102661 [Actinoplanes regularis]